MRVDCAFTIITWYDYLWKCTFKKGIYIMRAHFRLLNPNDKNTGHGDGTFSRVRTFPVDGVGIPGPAALAVGLLNKDIKHDIAIAHFSGNLVSVLLNTCTKDHLKHH
jgi:hypothetical protein